MTREAIQTHLRLINVNLKRLKKKQSIARDDFLHDETCQAAVEHWLQETIESCLKIGLALSSARGLDVGDTYGTVFVALFEAGILTEDLKDRLIAMTGFRNLLVHVYWRIEPEKVFDILHNNLRDIEEFARIALDTLED